MNPEPPLASCSTMLPIAVAMDLPDLQTTLALTQRLDPARCRVKVGKALFTAAGPQAVEALQRLGFEVFLDLKYHDIPETVRQASLAAAGLGVWMFNVHACGGSAMLQAARQAVDAQAHRPKLVAVTLLTSSDADQLAELGIPLTPQAYVLRLAQLAKAQGCDGVVCSGHDVRAIKQACGQEFICVTPGIRPEGQRVDDQKRTMSAQQALKLGADCLVMGRSLLNQPDPMNYLEHVCAQPNI